MLCSILEFCFFFCITQLLKSFRKSSYYSDLQLGKSAKILIMDFQTVYSTLETIWEILKQPLNTITRRSLLATVKKILTSLKWHYLSWTTISQSFFFPERLLLLGNILFFSFYQENVRTPKFYISLKYRVIFVSYGCKIYHFLIILMRINSYWVDTLYKRHNASMHEWLGMLPHFINTL